MIYAFSNSFETVNSHGESMAEENLRLAQARKASAFDIASETFRMIETGEIVDPELKRLCVLVFPELEYQQKTDILLKGIRNRGSGNGKNKG